MMKQSNNGDQSFLADLFSAEELEVSQILLQLPHIIAETLRLPLSVSWGSTRKRSVLDSTPPPISLLSSQSPFVHGSGGSKPNRESESPPTATNKVVALSPATPHSFPSSESEENHKSSKRKSSVKKKTDEFVGFIDGLNQRRDLLKGINAELERQKVASEFTNSILESAPVTGETLQYHPSLTKDQPAHNQRSQMKEISHYPPRETCSISGFGGKDLNLSPLGIPDLNIPLEESQAVDSPLPLDLSRPMAAQARQNRIQICRMKNSIVPSKPLFNSR